MSPACDIEITDLIQHLQQLNFPSSFSGEIVFEFSLNKGRVERVVLHEEASTLQRYSCSGEN